MRKVDTESLYFAYHNIQSISDFTSYIDRFLSKKPHEPVKGFFVVSTDGLLDRIRNFKNTYEYNVSINIDSDGFVSFDLERKKVSREDSVKKMTKGTAILFKTTKQNVYVVYTSADGRFVNIGLRKFFDSFYPEVTSVYLSSKNLENILSKVESVNSDSKVIAKKVVAYARIEDEFKIKGNVLYHFDEKKVREAEVKYTEELYKKSFENAIKSNAWVDKINYSLFVLDEKKNYYRSIHEAYLSRDGIFKVYSNLDFFIKTVAPEITQISQSLFVLLRNRNRMKEGSLDSTKPLKIVYESDIFSDVSENKKLISALDSLKNSSVSVFHGNPYVHLSLVDYLDGSSYDIWVLSTKEIIISPQLRASFASLNRILNHIFTKFQEGLIKDYREE